MQNDRFLREHERLSLLESVTLLTSGLGTVKFSASCDKSAAMVLSRVKDVIKQVNAWSITSIPSEQECRALLPDWFVTACAAPMSKAESERFLGWFRSLPPDQQARAEREEEWSLPAWLYWIAPDNRLWTWWDASVIDDKTIHLAVEVIDWPFPWGALRWLFRAAGATQLEPEA